MLYANSDDVEDADDVVEIRMPVQAAIMFDATQQGWHILQEYLCAQWEITHRMADAAEAEEAAANKPFVISTSDANIDPLVYQQFADIVVQNELESIWDEEQ